MTCKTKFNCLKASTVALFLLLFQPHYAQNSFPQLTRQLDEKSAALGKDFVLLMSGKDTLLYRKEGGTMKAKTVVPIGDASGWLTLALVLQFADEGKLSLDDKVVQYLPVFEKYGKNYITIRHCLSHLTGIQDKGGKLARLFDRKPHTTLDAAVAAFAAQEIETNPGTAFSYSSIGLHIAGRVLEVISKKRFDLLIKQKLLTPLGMRQTTFTTLDGSAPDPAAGARSTALDYMAFLKMLLNGGKHNGQQILSEAAIMELRNIQTAKLPMNNVPKAATGFQYALGAWALEHNGNLAAVLATPAMSGAWPVVDFCRGYSFLILPKEALSEPKSDLYGDLKKLTDLYFPSACR
jgi:CubicO group peptidase (beta-lactamase class C family)